MIFFPFSSVRFINHFFHEQAKLRRVNELSACSFPLEKHQKSHWDYLLEEMAWLANDFIQVLLSYRPVSEKILQTSPLSNFNLSPHVVNRNAVGK